MIWMSVVEVINAVESSDYEKEWFKYVRMEDGSFLFVTIDSMIQHCRMVEKGERAVSAGAINVSKKAFYFSGYGSDTLRLKWDSEDETMLSKVLSRPAVSKYDM